MLADHADQLEAPFRGMNGQTAQSNKSSSSCRRRQRRPVVAVSKEATRGALIVAIGLAVIAGTRFAVKNSRFRTIARRIVGEGISTRDVLSIPSSPQHAALKWIAHTDMAKLDPKDEYLLQRYALAVLWFASHDQASIKDIIKSQRTKDTEKSEKDFPNLDLSWSNETNWMSASGHCSWFGIACSPQQQQQHQNHHPNRLLLQHVTEPISTHVAAAVSFDGGSDVVSVIMPNNKIRGTIPNELFAAFTNLRMLVLDENVFFGTIPTTIQTSTHLQVLSLENNFLSGTLTLLAHLTNLVDLNLSDNELHGTIPPNLFSNLSDLLFLYLDGNRLTGSIPSSISRLSRLADLRLRDNHLAGTIPSQLGGVTSLEVMELDRNQLTGTIPSELGNLVALVELHIHRNQLTGRIPSELGNLENVKTIYLDHNKLTGPIPTEIGTLHHLKDLYLNDNVLTGSVPSGLLQQDEAAISKGKTTLQRIRLHHNGLTNM